MNPPAFQFYADDFLAGTMVLSQAEVGALIRLLCHQWNRGSIPVDTEKQQRLAGGSVSVDVLAKFKACEDGELRNERLEEVRAKQKSFSESQRQKGIKSAQSRQPRFNPGSTPAPTEPQPTPQPKSNSPVSSLHTPKEESSAAPPLPSIERSDFIDGWVKSFKVHFGFDYSFEGARDGKAVRELLRMQPAFSELLVIAKKAWVRAAVPPKAFNCEQAATIHGFRAYFNQIQVELKNGNTHQPRPNPRLEGVSRNNAVNNYAEAAKRKLERQVAEAANRPPPQAEGT